MKLKNKLLPIVALSGIATIAMPLTSCSCNGNGGGDTPIEDWEVIVEQGKEYTSLTPREGTDFETIEDAIISYRDDIINKNHKILADDIATAWYTISTLMPEYFSLKKACMKLTKIGEIETVQEFCCFRIDANIYLDGSFTLQDESVFEYNARTISIKNLPIILDPIGSQEFEGFFAGWIGAQRDYNPSDDNQWSINMPEICWGESSQTIGEENKDYNSQSFASFDKNQKNIFSMVVVSLVSTTNELYSNYLSNCTGPLP